MSRLERLLEKTAVLIHKKQKVITSEHQIQAIMHEYLEAWFPQFTKRPQINGTLKNFKPDGGIINIQTGIEFKLAKTKEEVKTTLSGLLEDANGYSGSKDWTRFFAVVYQKSPFVSRDQYVADFEKARTLNWRLILVNG